MALIVHILRSLVKMTGPNVGYLGVGQLGRPVLQRLPVVVVWVVILVIKFWFSSKNYIKPYKTYINPYRTIQFLIQSI